MKLINHHFDTKYQFQQYLVHTDLPLFFDDQPAIFMVKVYPNQIVCSINRTQLINTDRLTPDYATDIFDRVVNQHRRHWNWQKQYNQTIHITEYQRQYAIANAYHLDHHALLEVVGSFVMQLELIHQSIQRQLLNAINERRNLHE